MRAIARKRIQEAPAQQTSEATTGTVADDRSPAGAAQMRRAALVAGQAQRKAAQCQRLENEADLLERNMIHGTQYKFHSKVPNSCPDLRASGSKVIQAVSRANWPSQTIYHYAHAGLPQTINFGNSMEAFLDSNNPVQGTTPGGGPQAHARNDTQNHNHGDMVLGHLLNDNLGGPGMAHNLYPISDVANREHLATVEFQVKNAVMRNHGVPLVAGKTEHVEYRVNITPDAAPAGSGNLAAGGVTYPNATIFSRWRERNNGGNWLGWTQKTIHSNAADSMDAVVGGWGKHGSGQRLANDPAYLRVFPIPIIPGIAGPPLNTAGGAMPAAPAWATRALIEGRVTAGAGAAPGTFIGYIQ